MDRSDVEPLVSLAERFGKQDNFTGYRFRIEMNNGAKHKACVETRLVELGDGVRTTFEARSDAVLSFDDPRVIVNMKTEKGPTFEQITDCAGLLGEIIFKLEDTKE